MIMIFVLTFFTNNALLSQDATVREEQLVVEAESKVTESKVAELNIVGIKELSAVGRPLCKFVPQSVSAGLKLRESFLSGEDSESRAAAIQKLSLTFANEYGSTLTKDLPLESPKLFDFSNIDFASAIRGSEFCPEASTIFGPFAGKWYGRWAEREVDHHWSKVIKPNEHSFGSGFPRFQIGWQYAWIGDGYGINHCMSLEEQGKTKRFILGYTEHLEDGDFAKIVARRPHVGIYAGSGRLIWITAREVFFEETHANNEGELDSYSIIGFNYVEEADDGNARLVFRDGFVTEYSRSKNRRIPFVKLKLNGPVK